MTEPKLSTPVATYRLQLRNGMTFSRAAGLAEYLARLGISHLYVSPLFAAVPGSSHGYDGVDFGKIEPAIGGDDGFERLCAALSAAGLGLIVDFVPNHMAAADQNVWWQEVLEWGAASPLAAYFDVDWSQPKLLLPILGSTYEEALASGEFSIGFDASRGELFFTVYDRRLPLTPPSYALVLERADNPAVAGLAERFAVSRYPQTEAVKRLLATCAAKPDNARSIGRAIATAVSDHESLQRIHEAQIWRLAHWRLAREALTYRRFFEIAGLICMKVEDPQVFEAVHARLFQLIAAGNVSGVRFDHIDGLADPKSYLERFRKHKGSTNAQYLLVEKIIEPGEKLRSDWPVDGTTGYEFIAALAGAFVDQAREPDMRSAYEAFTGERIDYAVAAATAKREIFERNLEAELNYLTKRAIDIAAHGELTRDLGADSLRRAIIEMAVALPVYRTYVDESGPAPVDGELIAQAARTARSSHRVDNPAAVDFIECLLLLDTDEDTRQSALAFTARFQQTSGPVMAKAIEDTLFYRYNRLVALNEVGGSPQHYGAPLEDFHISMSERVQSQSGGLSATATHDTKRGEDARARLYVLSEIPQTWQQAVHRWSEMNTPYRVHAGHGPIPEPNVEWLFYQALAGVWPVGLSTDNEGALEEVRERMLSYMTKAVREGKTNTSWTDINEEYESALAKFVAAALSAGNTQFLDNFVNTCRPVWLAGAINSLAQLAIKLTAPGVPDLYQGCELWDLSLVDPDNRSPVDFAARESLLDHIDRADCASLLDKWETGAPKMLLTVTGLRTRANYPDLFASGEYVPLNAVGNRARNVIAFARVLGEQCALVIVPRFVSDLAEGASQPLVPPVRWDDTAIELPVALQNRPMRDVLNGSGYAASAAISVSTLLTRFPVAVLVAETS